MEAGGGGLAVGRAVRRDGQEPPPRLQVVDGAPRLRVVAPPRPETADSREPSGVPAPARSAARRRLRGRPPGPRGRRSRGGTRASWAAASSSRPMPRPRRPPGWPAPGRPRRPRRARRSSRRGSARRTRRRPAAAAAAQEVSGSRWHWLQPRMTRNMRVHCCCILAAQPMGKTHYFQHKFCLYSPN